MNTVAMNQDVVEEITKLTSSKTVKQLAVRTASINAKTGRCLFDFEDMTGAGLKADMVAVAVVFKNGRRTGQYYVIPGGKCPKKLLLKPGSTASKWHAFYCGSSEDLAKTIKQTLAYKPSEQLIRRLG